MFSMRLKHSLARLVGSTNQFERCSRNTIKVAEQLAGEFYSKGLYVTGNVPKSFLDVLAKAGKQLESNSQIIETALRTMSPTHTNGITTCWLDRYEGRWGSTVKLPANPEVQS
jgi:hypothetical protein